MPDILRKKIETEEFDYQSLIDCLEGYSNPRAKITQLLRKGIIIRIKKGLYVFGEAYRRRPYSKELLANLIYGPSYISLEYALQYYGLIPERVEAITSVTSGRSRKYSTPAGLFTYRRISVYALSTGFDRVENKDGTAFLIATPEKALADKIIFDRGATLSTQKKLLGYLENDLRIDMENLLSMNPDALNYFAKRYSSEKLKRVSSFIRKNNLQQKDYKHA
jgi:predicted transcriptional regulator of viral defense system